MVDCNVMVGWERRAAPCHSDPVPKPLARLFIIP